MCGLQRLGVAFALLALGAFAQAPDKPDFSGKWRLDLNLSRYDGVAAPHNMVMEISHHEPTLRIVTIATTDTGEKRETMELTTDGKPVAMDIEGRQCSATAAWDWFKATRLVVEVRCPGDVNSRRLTLGAKGQILTTVFTVTHQSAQKKAYEFFTRQGV